MSRVGRASRRLVRWLFGSPVDELPPEFGDPRPLEVRAYEKEFDVREELQKQRGTEPDPAVERHRPGAD